MVEQLTFNQFVVGSNPTVLYFLLQDNCKGEGERLVLEMSINYFL